MLLPRTDAAEAMAVAERIREAVSECAAETPVTISGGVATFPVDAADAAGLVGAADAALYASKGAGRDRIGAAGGSGEPTAAALRV